MTPPRFVKLTRSSGLVLYVNADRILEVAPGEDDACCTLVFGDTFERVAGSMEATVALLEGRGPPPAPTSLSAFHCLHRAWTATVGTVAYDKAAWTVVSKQMEAAGLDV